ncbi:MptD family putative ECF transporter S component [Streptococcus panodentis]|uniref:Trep_Strep domain-containing protein n=1 Tax=Streptococcus panodentis TaxID=1581472 RepID=A0ABS5AYA4_9STRE|nr:MULTISPECIES: MptD family putative ECF transporter S component [Streptococcus]KXT84809.1 Substrate-specific component of putative ECF transporter [Streptococcus sp. DD11]MBP2621411.1 hypothetical protein [Streptococcus panodentis]
MNKLKVKDIMLTGAFAALYFLCVGLGTFSSILFDRSGSMMYAPACAAVLGGTVYMLLQSKVRKFGAITLLGLVMGAFFLLSGHFFASFLPGMIFGLLADAIAKQGNYENKVINLLSFVVFSFVNSGPIILMWLARQTYINSLLARGKTQEYIDRVMLPVEASTVVWFVLTVVVGALIGGLFGQYLLKKHFVKAGMVS